MEYTIYNACLCLEIVELDNITLAGSGQQRAEGLREPAGIKIVHERRCKHILALHDPLRLVADNITTI